MSAPNPVGTVMKLTDTKQQLSRVINRVARGESRVVVEKSGLPVAAIISAEEYRRFKQQEARRASVFEAVARFSDAFADASDEESEREVAKALAEARAERRSNRAAGSGM